MRVMRTYAATPPRAYNVAPFEFLPSSTPVGTESAMPVPANRAALTARPAEPRKNSPGHSANTVGCTTALT